MQLRLALVAILTVLLIFICSASVEASPSMFPSVSAYINVGENGNASVTLEFSGRGSSSFWITLPKFERVNLCGLKGSYKLFNESSGAYFYYNTTITLYPSDDGSYELKLCFNFPYSVLMQDNRAWFMSPLLIGHSSVNITVFVSLPLLKKVLRETPSLASETGGYRVYILSRASQVDMQGRVVIEYIMEKSIPSVFIESEDRRIRVEYPQPYTVFAKKTLEVALQAFNQLQSLTGLEVQKVDFRFYLPEQRMGGLGALGFVRGEDVNVGGKGPIMLNLALTRFAPGYHETTIIHEMVHVFLGAVGVEANANTRWFHEGLAQYLSLLIAERIGVNVTDYALNLENGSRTIVSAYRGKISFVEKWPSGSEEEPAAYLASYYIVANISSMYGQAGYITKLFNTLKKKGGVKTTQEIVLAMSEAAGANLAPLFREWGFSNLSDWQAPSRAQEAEKQLVTVLALLGLVAGALIYMLNTKVKREAELQAAT